MEFSGRLAAVPLSDLLQWASNDRRTGCLVVRTAQRQKRVIFDRGEIVGCSSDDPNEYFGQFLLLNGYLEPEALVDALSWCRQHQRRLGAALAQLGVIPADRVQEALRRHIEDKVCELFLWQHGVFYFESHVPGEEELLPEPIHTVGLAMEGARWIDEDERMRRVFVHDNIVLRQGARWPLPAGEATPLQRRLLDAFVDGITFGELYHGVKGSRFRFLEALFELTVGSVLDIESVGEEVGVHTSTEIRILDLLMEQAAEEEVMFSGRHLSLPFDVLDRFYPVWVEDGGGEDLDEAARELLRQMDGSRSLRELVVLDRAHRERKMDLVLLQMREGRLALLPRPLEEMNALGKDTRTAWLRRLFLPKGT